MTIRFHIRLKVALTYIWEVVGSNLCLVTGFPERGFHGFPRPLQEN